jgi:hypothetical protein
VRLFISRAIDSADLDNAQTAYSKVAYNVLTIAGTVSTSLEGIAKLRGETGCLPNCKKKGEKPVAVEVEVFIANDAKGNFSTQSTPVESTKQRKTYSMVRC